MDAQDARLVDNIVHACTNVRRLQSKGYEFLSRSPGFSTHGGYQAFIAHYAAKGSLGRDVLRFAPANRYDNLLDGPMAAHYQHKAALYARVVARLMPGGEVSGVCGIDGCAGHAGACPG